MSRQLSSTRRATSPYVNRLKLFWTSRRARCPPSLPGPSRHGKRTLPAYLEQVDELYAADAYNSLSIEGYQVSEALIERVRAGNWNPDNDENDRQNRNALAARGYWQAFQRVKKSLDPILAGENPGVVVRRDYDAWYAELFGPSISAGILKPASLAGFRNSAVFIRRSMHVPPSHEAVRELMPEFFELLQAETEPAVRVVLGHFRVRLYPSIYGRKWPHGALSDEYDDGGRRLSVDHHPRGKTRRVYGGPRNSERRAEHLAIRRIPRKSRKRTERSAQTVSRPFQTARQKISRGATITGQATSAGRVESVSQENPRDSDYLSPLRNRLQANPATAWNCSGVRRATRSAHCRWTTLFLASSSPGSSMPRARNFALFTRMSWKC